MVCSLSVFETGQVDAAGAITHYNVDFLQETSSVAISNQLVVVAADANNSTITTGGAVILTCSDPNAILPTNTTLIVNAGGIATCRMYFGTVGTQTVTVTDTTDNTIVGTLTVIVAQIHFGISVTPTTILAGESVNVTVTALDGSSNVLTDIGTSGYGRQLEFSSTDSQAVFPLQGSPSNLVNGTGVFNVTLNTSGSQTITATNRDFPLVNVTTNAVTVNPAATPTVSPTTEATPTPTSQPTASPTLTPTISPTQTAQTTTENSHIVIIVVVLVIVVFAVLGAVLFMRKRKGSATASDFPPPPPPT